MAGIWRAAWGGMHGLRNALHRDTLRSHPAARRRDYPPRAPPARSATSFHK